MNVVEIVFISVALSLDVFVATLCLGAVLPEIKRGVVVKLCILYGFWQVLALIGGHMISMFAFVENKKEGITSAWHLISVMIFIGLGIRMFNKAWKREPFLEKRLDRVKIRTFLVLAVLISLDAFFAGISMGFLQTELLVEIVVLLISTVFFVITGLYTGYRMGYEEKHKTYYVSGSLLVLAGLDVLIKFLL